MSKYIFNHDFPKDLRVMSYDELEILSYEVRDFLLENISKTGGHLSSNLGVVELTIALHKVFDTPNDKIIWDVGHQTYVHKILTGRADKLNTIRQLEGMSGFPKSSESPYDIFDTGHSSTSLSLSLGMAAARDMDGDDYNIVSVIGDGAMTGGLAYEALNNISTIDSKLIVILNDNGMSISPNTGGLSKYLGRLRSSRKYINVKESVKKGISKIPVIGEGIVAGIHYAKDSIKYAMIDGIIFEEFGLKYLGPIDGHNIRELCETLELAKELETPVLIHTITQKGKGYTKAEANPNVFHGIGPFSVDTGQLLKKSAHPTYSGVFGNKLIDMADRDKKIVGISAAMMDGTGLERFRNEFPDRAFDVGIAEEYAVSFAAGLARTGYKPFVAVYSTFLQRSYDQIVEDVCLQKLPVVFCIDRAGIVGSDGETHHGIFDLSFLKHIPNLTIMSPSNGRELEEMMEMAVSLKCPCAIRYPRGIARELTEVPSQNIGFGQAQRIADGENVDIWAIGSMVEKALEACSILKEDNIHPGLVNMRFLKPFDASELKKTAEKYKVIYTVEDNVLSGGAGEEIDALLAESHVRVVNLGWPDKFIEHGKCDQLYEKYQLDGKSIAERIKREFEN